MTTTRQHREIPALRGHVADVTAKHGCGCSAGTVRDLPPLRDGVDGVID